MTTRDEAARRRRDQERRSRTANYNRYDDPSPTYTSYDSGTSSCGGSSSSSSSDSGGSCGGGE